MHDAASDETVVVDPAEAGPVLAEAEARGWRITQIWNTHRSEEHTSELQSLMRISYAVFCLKKKITHTPYNIPYNLSNIVTNTSPMPHYDQPPTTQQSHI